MTEPQWITNSPEVAAALKYADRTFDIAMSHAVRLKLADKIVAIRVAKANRQRAYDAVRKDA